MNNNNDKDTIINASLFDAIDMVLANKIKKLVEATNEEEKNCIISDIIVMLEEHQRTFAQILLLYLQNLYLRNTHHLF